MTVIPICIDCVHFINDRRFTCKAFPDGIPDPIITMKHDHHDPYPGDHGVQFEPETETKAKARST